MSAATPASTPPETPSIATGGPASPSGGDSEAAAASASFWRVLTKFDHTKVSAHRALRNAAGVVLPLIVGYALGMPRGGLVVASGALNVSYSDGSDPYSQRAKRMVRSAVVCAIAVFAGAISGPHSALAIGIATLWAFTAGLLAALGTAAADLGVISLVTLLIYAAQPLTTHQAVISGALALAGGLFQAGLSVALWPVQRYEPERRALATLLTQLASIAEAPLRSTAAPAASAESDAAHEALSSLEHDATVEAMRYRSLLNQAERIRLTLLTLKALRSRMERESLAHQATAIAGEALSRAASALRAIAALLTTQNFANTRDDFSELRRLAQLLREESPRAPTSFFSATTKDTAFQLDALAGQLRAVRDLAANSTPVGQAAFTREEARQPWWLQFRGVQATLRANFSLDSSAFRHAIRLAVMVAISETLSRTLSHMYNWRRSYWMPLTIVLVLKPEFTTTFSRGLLRIAGTIAGLLLATALFHVLPINVASQILLIFAFTFLLRWVGPANYGIFGIAVSALVVLLIAIAGVPPQEVIWARGVNTAAGGVLALLAYWIWPTWERTRVAERFAKLLDAYREYFRALADAYVNGTPGGTKEIDRARRAARLARSNLEGSIDRLGSEPGTTARQISQLNAILASTHRLVHAVMALEAGWAQPATAPPRPAFRVFAADVEKTLLLLADALRGKRVMDKDFPDLRADHNRLVESGDERIERYALSNVEADRITNSLNTARELVLEWVRSPEHRQQGTPARSTNRLAAN